MSGNFIGDTGPTHLSQAELTQLESLNLSHNLIGDTRVTEKLPIIIDIKATATPFNKTNFPQDYISVHYRMGFCATEYLSIDYPILVQI
jgi:hypothetical protein